MSKKRLSFLFGGMILIACIMVNLNLFQSPSYKITGLRLANIEALANSESSDCGSTSTCPNGGQRSKGVAKPKKSTETLTADSNGNITVNGKPFSVGASYSNKKCKVVIGWVECKYSEAPDLDCCVCNHYVISVGGA